MTKINFARVILGGLAAGIILILGDTLMHTVVLGEQWTAAMAAQGVAEPGASAIVFFSILDLIIGVAMVWLYAAIRPRFGAGARTAIVTGLVVWFFGWFWKMSGLIAMEMYPSNLIFMTLAWRFIQIPIAALVGGWLYKE